MGEVKWTKEQSQAIFEKEENILVSAAAGSGKTAVLVERIIQKILKDKIDVDKILVVTFTNAAAAEMRERILEAIYKKLDEQRGNSHLQRQIMLLNRANISTIHAFCLEVIKNNFYEIDLAPNFRIGDTAEIELLKQDVLEDLLEELYEKQDEDFLKLVEAYAGYRGDDALKEIILKIYNYIQSNPFPEEWLEEKVSAFKLDDEEDFANTIWGEILLEDFRQSMEEIISSLKFIYKKLKQQDELSKFSTVIAMDIENYQDLLAATNTWDGLYKKAFSIEFAKWPIDKKVNLELKEEAKQIRDKAKKNFTTKRDKILIYTSKEASQDIKEMYAILEPLKKLILEFSKRFAQGKKEKNCIDFNDIEHYALKILVKKEEDQYVATKVAKKYQEKFEEIAIDEYQDSNLVQEYILTTISRGNNLFMVGDVKQSIYKFRQARPELFLEKYEKYKLLGEEQKGEDVKIQLFQNFRSRSNILNLTNLVFDSIMTKKLGDIDYTEKEYLRQEKDYAPPEEENTNFAGKAELHIIDLASQEEEDAEEVDEQDERIESTELEAKWVANKIKEILNSNYLVFDKKKKTYRKASYRDIVILLRATSVAAPVYEKAISDLEIPVFSDTSSEYLSAIEIQTVLSVLKILDNPLQDIPLVSVLRSAIGGFTDEELIQIRLLDKKGYFYEALQLAQNTENEELQSKTRHIIGLLDKWRSEQEYLSLEELIWNIYMDTGYYQYVSLMPDGNLRTANLKMLLERARQYENASFKGLFNFLQFIDKLKSHSGDLGAAKLIGENEDVVRIMSIHKSKGLEFPIVFLCGTGKKFNLKDLNDSILLHHEIGLGPKYINMGKGIEYNTLAKEAIHLESRTEAISEEMRVLYVALTRSREKLIITGVDKNFEKSKQKKEADIEMYGGLTEGLLQNYISYLDWLELIAIEKNSQIKELVDMHIHTKGEILKNKQEEKTEENNLQILLEKKHVKEDKELERKLRWSYEHKLSTTIPSKTSVSEIKQRKTKEETGENKQSSSKENIAMPMFLRETDELTSSQKGSALHLCMQKLDLKNNYQTQEIKEEIEKLVANKILTAKEAESISIAKIEKFLHSDLASKIRKAKHIEKEVPFYMQLSAKEAFEKETDEKVLVQGIVDLYFETEESDIILVDYKTDYVPKNKENELIQKYQTQLLLYKKAIEEAKKKKVSEIYIYSTYLDKEIKIENLYLQE